VLLSFFFLQHLFVSSACTRNEVVRQRDMSVLVGDLRRSDSSSEGSGDVEGHVS